MLMREMSAHIGQTCCGAAHRPGSSGRPLAAALEGRRQIPLAHTPAQQQHPLQGRPYRQASGAPQHAVMCLLAGDPRRVSAARPPQR